MADLTVRAKIPASEINTLINNLSSILNGRLPDKHRLRDTFWAAYSREWFVQLHKSFSRKSRHGTDEFGDRWKKLKKESIAQKKVGRSEQKKLGIALRSRKRGLLTPSQNKQWKGIFRSIFIKLAPKVGEEKAKIEAGKSAWAIMKSKGAETKLDVLGNRNLPIGIEDGTMEKSLRPGSVQGTRYRPPKGQVARMEGNRMILGTDVPHAAHFHRTRRLWSAVRSLSPWQTKAVHAGTRAVAQRLQKVL